MEREFKFKVGQYVTFSDKVVDAPKYPCKITYRFFDGQSKVYILNVSNGEERPVFEDDLILFAGEYQEDSIIQMQREILSLQERVAKLKLELANIKGTSNSISSSIQDVVIRKYVKSGNEEGEICLPEE